MLRQWLGEPESTLPFAAQRPSASPAVGASGLGGRGNEERMEAAHAPSFELDPTAVTEAHDLAVQAAAAAKKGDLHEAIRAHLAASQLYLEAAERMQDNEVTGSALLLLSDGHARQAYTWQLALQQKEEGGEQGREARVGGGAALVKQKSVVRKADPAPGQQPPQPPPPAPPQGPSQALPDGSLYASAVGPPSADKTTWASHVDDMLELERQLNALGMNSMNASGIQQPLSGGTPSGRYLSSTLGESFFVVSNRNAAAREGAGTPVGEGGGGGGMSASALRGSKILLRQQQQQQQARDRTGLPPDGRMKAGGKVGGQLRGGQQQAQEALSAALTGNQQGGGMQQQQAAHLARREGAVGSGSLLDSIGPVHQGEMVRLLEAMQTLSEENAQLIKQLDECMRFKQEVEKTRLEMKEFQDSYKAKFKSLRQALEEFKQKYGHETNPVNHVTSPMDRARIEALETEVQRLSQRLALERELGKKKDMTLKRYEQWYKTLRASAQSRGSKGGGGGGGNGGGGGGGGSSSQRGGGPVLTPQQQQQLMLQQQQAALRGPGSSSGGRQQRRDGPPLR